jgi:hypothetical protein
VDVACRNAKGQTAAASIVSGIWGDFQGPMPGVKSWDGVPMSYWAGGIAVANDTPRLVADRNGQCGSWASLLRDTFLTHGLLGVQKYTIISAYDNLVPPTQYNPLNLSTLLIKDWSFVGAGSAPSFLYPFTHLPSEYSDSTGGKPGQNNQNPPGKFRNHFVVFFDNNYYDPSYGTGPFSTQTDWENASLDGFEIETLAVSGGNTVIAPVAKKNGTAQETSFIPFP